jgi:hypothetical protein
VGGYYVSSFEVYAKGEQTLSNFDWLPLLLWLAGFLVFALAAYLRNEYIGLMSSFFFIISGIYIMINGLGIVYDTYTQAVAYITLGIGLIIAFVSVAEMFFADANIFKTD